MRLNRCDYCGGKFGLIQHHSWSKRFCSKHCKSVDREQKCSPRAASRFLVRFFWTQANCDDRVNTWNRGEQLAMLLHGNEGTMATVKPGRPSGPPR
jgi:hypothetical protein